MSTDIGAFIIRTPGVAGGRPCIAGTRVPVRSVAVCYKQGYLPEEIVAKYERLTLAHVYAALAYYHANQAEIETDLTEEEAAHERLARKHRPTRKKA
jgi:uncharacterized protein (DUF433 family)